MGVLSVSTTVEAKVTFFQAAIGQKIAMALSGAVMFGFLIGHVAGNLQVFAGAEKINDYSRMLHETPALLWGTRLTLIAAVLVHIRSAVSLYARRSEARPIAYAKKKNRASTLASRLMAFTGAGLLAFIVFHILHFTTGHAHHDFHELEPFHNLVTAFQSPAIAGAYVVAMLFVGNHLFHGLYSASQSLGIASPHRAAQIKTAAAVVAVVLAGAFALVPIAILAQLVG